MDDTGWPETLEVQGVSFTRQGPKFVGESMWIDPETGEATLNKPAWVIHYLTPQPWACHHSAFALITFPAIGRYQPTSEDERTIRNPELREVKLDAARLTLALCLAEHDCRAEVA